MDEPESIERFDTPQLEALVEIMVLAASADGEFSDEERQRLRTSVLTLTSRRLSPERIDPLLNGLERRIASEGRAARLATVRAALGSPASRRVALDLALQVMAADGVLRTSERELVLDIAVALEIDPNEAADMVRRAVESMERRPT
ncbi:MAG: tellurite resistance TerB family protein [Polyangiaceae bacterium]